MIISTFHAFFSSFSRFSKIVEFWVDFYTGLWHGYKHRPNSCPNSAESPRKPPKQTQPNANGLKLRTADGVNRILISNLFGFKSMQETSNLSLLWTIRSEAGSNPYTDKPIPEPIQPPCQTRHH